MNFSQVTTVLIIYGINILFAAASVCYSVKDRLTGQIIYAIILVIVLWFVLHTTIISDKNPSRTEKIFGFMKLKNKKNK